MKFRHGIFVIISFIFCSISIGQNNKDAFDTARRYSKDPKLSLDQREKYAKEALQIAENLGIDSLIFSTRKTLSLVYLDQEHYDLYTALSRKNLLQAQKNQDTSKIASAYLNIGQSYYFQYVNDSAFIYGSKARELYNSLGDKENEAVMLVMLSDIQETERDYLGSEENAVAAIKMYESFERNEYNLLQLYNLNNLLGIISLKINNYKKSLEYHNKAEEISDEMSNGFYNKIGSINNKAFVYQKQKNYNKSLELYNELIDIREQYNEYDPTFYPLVLSNLASTKLLAKHDDFDKMESLFKEAYAISKNVEDEVTELQVSIDLAKFYLHTKNIDSSRKYAQSSYKIAKKISSNEILLEALQILSKLEVGEQSKAYLYEHIKLSDSLINIERSSRSKFGRIKYDTENVEKQNERMSQQLIWLIAVATGLAITIILVYIIITQRAKNKELRFEKDQQKANEEIYNLMLSQQDKVDEARANEKKRISEELHDGVLGRLFGTRLSLDSLNFSEGKEAIQNRATYISELKTIENDIRKISHDLNTDFVSGSGFMDIVSELIEKQTKAYQLKSSFEYTDDINWETVHNKTKINIYRIIQESLQNIYKHANANSVKISIELKNNVICLSISDDGDGFDVNKSKKGIGLKNINSRVTEVEGKVAFRSILKKGTEVSITIPYKN